MADIQKRELKFENFDEVMQEVNSLIESGYTSKGNWNLAQCCGHLSRWLSYPMDGFPRPPLPIRGMLWVMKVTIAPSWKKRILADGFWGGMQTDPKSVPTPDEKSDREAASQFQATIDRAKTFDGTLIPSPLFGEQDREMYTKVNLLHAEHHLGYFEPKA